MDNILALDLGNKCGWRLRRNGRYHGGTSDFSGSPERIGQRYYNFRRFLWRIVKSLEPDPLTAVVYERVQFVPRMGGLKAAQSWAGYEATLTCWCEHVGVAYIGVAVGTLKKDFTGNGRASKEDMLDHARALGWRPQDDNDADAIALMEFYEVNHEKRERRRPGYEKVSVQEQGFDL
jgi:Holliday junction resolvasome RuvABC endonuclease subunit